MAVGAGSGLFLFCFWCLCHRPLGLQPNTAGEGLEPCKPFLVGFRLPASLAACLYPRHARGSPREAICHSPAHKQAPLSLLSLYSVRGPLAVLTIGFMPHWVLNKAFQHRKKICYILWDQTSKRSEMFGVNIPGIHKVWKQRCWFFFLMMSWWHSIFLLVSILVEYPV